MLADRQEMSVLGTTRCLAYNFLYRSHSVSNVDAEKKNFVEENLLCQTVFSSSIEAIGLRARSASAASSAYHIISVDFKGIIGAF